MYNVIMNGEVCPNAVGYDELVGFLNQCGVRENSLQFTLYLGGLEFEANGFTFQIAKANKR